jgi:hypothetical protein
MASRISSFTAAPAGRSDRSAVEPAGIGHNGGPALLQGYKTWLWKKAHEAVWKTPPREIMLRRLRRAKALGMTYREYTLEILERGRYL